MFKSRSTIDRVFDSLLGYELQKLNTHLPKQRKTLNELLRSEAPVVEAVDGSSIIMRTSELQELAKIIPEQFRDKLKLPLIVVRRMDLGKSIYVVLGEHLEEFTVKRILGLTDDDYHNMYRDRGTAYLYRPQVSELLRKFHSLVVVGFGIPRELSDHSPSRV